jgi:DNA-binding NtrC family response regulator
MGRVPTVMIVNDEPGLQKTIAKFLAEEKIAVLTASTNREAVAALDNRIEDLVDLILINRKIPGSTMTALYPVKPCAKTQELSDTCLSIPFTKQQLMDFLQTQL